MTTTKRLHLTTIVVNAISEQYISLKIVYPHCGLSMFEDCALRLVFITNYRFTNCKIFG